MCSSYVRGYGQSMCGHSVSKDAGGAGDRILVVRGVLVAEPEGEPGAVGALFKSKVNATAQDEPLIRRAVQSGSYGVCRQIRTASIEREFAPSLAKRRPSSVSI